MSLQAFSNSLLELYEVAEQAGPNHFPDEVVRIVNKLISFDGALLGIGCADIAHKAGLMIDRTVVSPTRNTCMNQCSDYALATLVAPTPDPSMNSSVDPITALFAKGFSKPLATDYKALYQGRKQEEIEEFYRYHDWRKLLLYGDAPSTTDDGRWVILYRSTGDDFTESEVFLLKAMWHHVTRTIEINLNHALNHIDPYHSMRAMALVSSRGIIETTNSAFTDLLKIEWPAFSVRSFPLHVISTLLNNGTYRGKQIEISASQKFGCLACIARRLPLVNTLAPTELNVADRFAKGMTHSQIAAILHVSPHTVRNQLAQVYQKLGVHSKIELMRAMSSQ